MTSGPSDPGPPAPVTKAPPVDAAAHLRRFLMDCPSTCPGCRKQLVDLTAQDSCPACLEPLSLHLAARPMRVGRWLALLVPSIMASGIGLFFAILVLVSSPSILRNPLIITYLCENLGIPLSLLILRFRHNINRWPRPLHALATIAVICAAAIPILMFIRR